MPSQNRKPTSVHTLNNWQSTGGAGSEVTVVTDGLDGSYMVDATLAEDLYYEYENVAAPDGSLVSACLLNCRWWNPSAGADGSAYPRARVGGTGYSGATAAPGNGYTNIQDSFAAQVPDIGTFNASQFGAQEINYSSSPLRLVEQSVDVTWTPPLGGFLFLIGQWLGPLVAVGLEEMGRLSRALWRASGVRLVGGELEAAWRELRYDPRRRLFLPGSR